METEYRPNGLVAAAWRLLEVDAGEPVTLLDCVDAWLRPELTGGYGAVLAGADVLPAVGLPVAELDDPAPLLD
jgi:hypothetical protein